MTTLSLLGVRIEGLMYVSVKVLLTLEGKPEEYVKVKLESITFISVPYFLPRLQAWVRNSDRPRNQSLFLFLF